MFQIDERCKALECLREGALGLSRMTTWMAKSLVPKTLSGFVTYLFLHAVFFTLPTPLFRVTRGRWMGGGGMIDLISNSIRSLFYSCYSMGDFTNVTQGLGLISNWKASAPVTMQCMDGEGIISNFTDAAFLYRDEVENPGIDSAFGLHAFYSLLWPLLAFLQMAPIRKMSLKLHGYFGYIAMASFFMHMWASYNILFFDDGQHVLANRDRFQLVQ